MIVTAVLQTDDVWLPSPRLKSGVTQISVLQTELKANRYADLKAESRKLKAKDRETTDDTDYTEKTINASPPFLMHNA